MSTSAALSPVPDVDSLVSTQTYQLIHLICSSYIATFVCLLGAPANLLNCIVFYSQGLHDRMNICLFSLGLVDLSFLLSVSAVSSVSFFIGFFNKALSEEYLMKTMTAGLGVIYGFRSAAGCITMVIAVERCVCVLLPLRATLLMSTRQMRALFASVVVLLQIIYIAIPLKVTVVSVARNNSGETTWYVVPTALGVTYKGLLDAVSNTLLSVTLPLVTFVVVSAASAVTVVRLRSAIKWRETSSSVDSNFSRHQVALTKMLVLVSLVFIVSMAPFVAVIIARLLVDDFSPYGRYYNLYMSCNTIVNQLPQVNSAHSFLVYSTRSSRFRRHLRTALGGPCKVRVRHQAM